MNAKILIADKLSTEAVTWLQQQEGLEVVVSPGLDEGALCAAIALRYLE